jgi:protein O-mannosyl-transferase
MNSPTGGASPLLHRHWPKLLLIAVVACIAYSNTFSAPFVLDDENSITQNPVIKHLDTFISGAGFHYNPRRFVGYLTFALNYRFSGLDVAGYHVVNLAIHIVSALLVYALASVTLETPFFRRSGAAESMKSFVPVAAALLFVAHPIQTEAVTYIVQRLAALAALFYIGAVAAYAKGRIEMARGAQFAGRPLFWFALSLVSALLAFLTKENTATLPFMLLLYEVSFFGITRKKMAAVAGLAAVAAALCMAAALASPKPLGELLSDISRITTETRIFPRETYFLTQLPVIVTYLRLLVLPLNQNLDYDYPIFDSPFAPPVILSFLLLAALAGLAVFFYRRSAGEEPEGRSWMRLSAFGIAWFFLALSVESSFIPISDVIVEHRLYLPTAGLFIAVAAAVAALSERLGMALLRTGLVAVVALLSLATFQRNGVWKDSLTIWSDSAAKSPMKKRPLVGVADSLRLRGDCAAAIPVYARAMTLGPFSPDNYSNFALCYRKTGDVPTAESLYRQALRLDPCNAPALNNLGVIRGMLKDYREAEESFKKSLSCDAKQPEAHLNLGLLNVILGRNDRAEKEFREAVEIDPSYGLGWEQLAKLALSRGGHDKGNEYLSRGGRVSPRPGSR